MEQERSDTSARFVGLVHALRASAEAALGDDTGPLRLAPRDGVQGLRAARRSLGLLEMLHEKTLGNLGDTERDTLWSALRSVRARIADWEGAMSAPSTALPMADDAASGPARGAAGDAVDDAET